jgi:2-dehydro-3-deoxyphosphogalactonate aldolase
MELRALLRACPIVSILRGIRPDEAESMGAALARSGVRIVEVPLNSPEPLKSISILAEKFSGQLLVGAGTVTRPEEVTRIASAGGKLIVTPHADLSVLQSAKHAGLVAIPGAFSPTEAFAVLQNGADAIKLFPAENLGVGMLKSLLAVLPARTIVVAVGGIDARNASSWLEAGALGVGVGSSIFKPGDTAFKVLASAQELVSSLEAVRERVSAPCFSA